jgi:hypothetical protein
MPPKEVFFSSPQATAEKKGNAMKMERSTASRRRFCQLALGWMGAMGLQQNVSGQDAGRNLSFRMDTDIYADVTKPPLKRSTTLFLEGRCYDMEQSDSPQVTVIDTMQSRIALLDRLQQCRTEVAMEQLQLMIASARQQLSPEQAARFAESISVEVDSATSELIVSNSSTLYRCKMQDPPHATIAAQYAIFADSSAWLNAAYPPHLPPYVRLSLNRELAQRGKIPLELVRIVRNGQKESRLTVKHLCSGQVGADDLAKQQRIDGMLAEFKLVTIEEFYRSKAVAKR